MNALKMFRLLVFVSVLILNALSAKASIKAGEATVAVGGYTTVQLGTAYQSTLRNYGYSSYKWTPMNSNVSLSSESVYSVKVKGVSPGTTRLEYFCSYWVDGLYRTMEFYWDITITGSSDTSGPTGIRVTPSTAQLQVGEKCTLEATIYGGPGTCGWTSSNSNVATVSGSGTTATVTAKKEGTAYIYATTNNGYFEKCAVTVIPAWPDGYTYDVKTKEGCVLYFEVLSAADKTCKVYNNENYNHVGAITIPETADGYKVIEIAAYTFQKNNLTSVVIPNTVTSIGESAFQKCENLVTVRIPNSVKSLGARAFDGCKKLSTATLPNSLTTIENFLFYHCDNLTSIDIPNSVTTIGDSAFEGCTGVTSLTMGNSVTSIGTNAFRGCKMTSVTFPATLKEIGSSAFWGCEELSVVNFPNTVFSIATSAFVGTPWYNNQDDGIIYIGSMAYKYKGTVPDGTHVTIKNGTEAINQGCFSGCSGMTSISIPNSVKSIGRSAFEWCRGLTSISIPNSVKSIGGSAFSGCSGLTSLLIPKSVSQILGTLFSSCSNLVVLKVDPGNVTYDSRNDCNAIIETASNTLISGCRKTVIPSTVTAIGPLAFRYCDGLSSIRVPESVMSIGWGAFAGCYDLQTAVISGPVKTLESSLFNSCESLVSVKIPHTITKMSWYIFSGCAKLKDFYCLMINPAQVKLDSSSLDRFKKDTCVLHVPIGTADSYRAAAQWNEFENIVEDAWADGDVNTDGEVGIADVTTLVAHVLTQDGGVNSDVNGDGETSIADVTALVNLLLKR